MDIEKYLKGQDERVLQHIKIARAALDSLESYIEAGCPANFEFNFDPLIRATERRDTLLFMFQGMEEDP